MEESSRANEIVILQAVAKTLTSTLDQKEVLAKIMDIIAEIFQPEDWSLLMLDEEREELYFEVVVGARPSQSRTSGSNWEKVLPAGWPRTPNPLSPTTPTPTRVLPNGWIT